MTTDRRHTRSNRPEVALSLLCDSVAKECGLDAIVVGQEGLMVAGAGQEREGHLLAAFTPLLSETRDAPARERMFEFLSNHIDDARPAKLAMRAARAGQGKFFVAVRGDSFAARDLGMRRVISGINRILS